MSCRLIPRDYEMMLFVGLCKYVCTGQLKQEFFTSLNRARRRIRKLFDAGLLDIHVAGSTSQNLVSLSKEGLALVKKSFPQLTERLNRPGTISLAGVEHHLAVVDVRQYLATLTQTRSWALLGWQSGSGALAQELGLLQFRLRPDALAEIETNTNPGTITLGIEVDCGTENMGFTLAGKLDKYGQVFLSGDLIDELWIVVTGGKLRQQSLEEQVRQAGLEQWTRVIAHSLLLTRPVVSVVDEAAGQGV
jgi:hypothetical protein